MATNKERLKELTDRLEAGLSELFTSEKYAEYLKVMSSFTHYSVNNTMLIALQKPEATLVAGYQAWEKKFKRHVMKGEKGIRIISPAPRRETVEKEKIDPRTGAVIMGTDGKPETEEVTVTIPRFVPAVVFDVSQTDGEPLPDLGGEELTASVENYEIFMKAIRSVSPVPIRFADISGSAKGYYDNVKKEIVVREGMSESQSMKTAIHETVHARLHDRDYMKDQGIKKDKETVETEAESCAFVVCAHFGLDTSDYSFPYLAGWASSREAKELKASMNTIRRTAGEIIDGIEESMREQLKERQEDKGKDNDIFMIFQLNDDEKGIKLKFENMDYLQANGLTVERENYHFVYSGVLKKEDTLDGIYERFNVDHPKDYKGHSLSVSDVIVLKRNGEEQAYFVDSVGYQKLTDFAYHARPDQDRQTVVQTLIEDDAVTRGILPDDEKSDTQKSSSLDKATATVPDPLPYSQCAYETPDGYFSIHSTEEGYDYSFFDRDYKLLDGGLLENEPGKDPRTIDQAVTELFSGSNLTVDHCREVSFDELTDHTDDANPPPAATAIEQFARDLDDFLHSHDTYEYWDRVEDRDQNVTEIMNDLHEGVIGPIKEYLETAHKEKPTAETETLLKRLAEYDRKELHPSFYVAECMEFPVMGEYHDHLTIDEAVEIYESIPSDRMHGIKGIGIDLDDGSPYSGSIDLMQGGWINTEAIESIDYYRKSPLINQALQELREHYPDRDPTQVKESAVTKLLSEKTLSESQKNGNSQRETNGKKESVLQALKEHQQKVKAQEDPERDNRQKEKKKGEPTI
ncbi:MAG: hypothetical protein IJI25_12225 [Eubacterium sp.]|nr:hypothetical protein [Eubacterium sp.]